MMKIGNWNALTVLRDSPHGLYLGDEAGNDVLLPNKYCPREAQAGDVLNVFLYRDGEDRLVATTLTPYIRLNSFAYLQVVQVNTFGAFLDWGLEKDLMVPYRLQEPRMEVGRRYMVYMFLDELTGRLVATNKIRKYLNKEEPMLEPGEEVMAHVYEETPVGFKVIVNNRFTGMIYRTELFQPMRIGDEMKAFVKAVRPDGKVDVVLQRQGFEHVDEQTEAVLAKLKAAGGELPVGDRSEPGEVLRAFHMSKKNFKRAAGMLMKQGLVVVDDNRILLTRKAMKG